MTEPMAVMENCSPTGTPMPSSRRASAFRSRQSSFSMRKTSKCFRIYHTHSSPEPSCETTVAIAAPATPMPSTQTVSRSSTILMTDAMARNHTGDLLSPSERSTQAPIL